MKKTRQAGLAVVAVVAAGILVLVFGYSASGRRYQPAAGDDRPPVSLDYDQALKRGLAGDYSGSQAAFLRLAHEQRGTNAGAWSLYQATIAARAMHDPPHAERLTSRLRREYPGHPLALRLTPDPVAPPERAVLPYDCGPRALKFLCQEAVIQGSLGELRRLCRTTRDGTTMAGLLKAARAKGFRAEAAQVDAWFLRRHRPCGIAWFGSEAHYAAFLPGPDSEHVWLLDPNEGERRLASVEDITRRSQGVVLLAAWGARRLPSIGG